MLDCVCSSDYLIILHIEEKVEQSQDLLNLSEPQEIFIFSQIDTPRSKICQDVNRAHLKVPE